MDRLTDSEYRFVQWYAATGSISAALEYAGYNQRGDHSVEQGTFLLSLDHIKQAVETVRVQSIQTPAQILAKMSKIAGSSMADVLSIDDSGNYTFDSEKAQSTGGVVAIKKFERSDRTYYDKDDNVTHVDTTIKVELHDSLKALDLLAKHHQLYQPPTISWDLEVWHYYLNGYIDLKQVYAELGKTKAKQLMDGTPLEELPDDAFVNESTIDGVQFSKQAGS